MTSMVFTILKIHSAILLVLLTTSCSFINKIIDSETSHQADQKEIYRPNSCETNSWAILGNSASLSESFKTFLDLLNQSKIKTTFVDRASLWLLVQAYAHPHLASPTARISYFMQNDSFGQQYQDVTNNNELTATYPLFFAIDKLLKNNKSHYSLHQLVKFIDKYFATNITVEKSLQLFIEQNKKMLRQDQELKGLFFRGKQTVKQDESLQRFSLAKLVEQFEKHSHAAENYQVDAHLYSYQAKRLNAEIRCNYDLNLYQHHIYLLSSPEKQALPIGYIEGKKQLLASFSQDTSRFKSLGVGYLIGGDSTQGLRPAFCHLSNKDFSLTLLSNKDRDPAQLLHSLIEESSLSFSSESISDALSQGRQLILLNPHRAVVESKNLSEERLDKLIKNRVPIYHYCPIGNIQAIFYQQQQAASIFTDSRNNNSLFCLKRNTNQD